MNTSASNLPSPKSYYGVGTVIFFGLLLLTACQKPPEPEEAQSAAQATVPVTINVNEDKDVETQSAQETAQEGVQEGAKTAADPKRDMSLAQLEQDLADTANDTAIAPNPEQAIKGAQITDVRYKSAAGDSLSVTFETSAAGVLNAIITRSGQPKITLSAPEGQGNNPTYRSADGRIQLVSHAGGSAIDLIQNDQATSFDAISADAEVITE